MRVARVTLMAAVLGLACGGESSGPAAPVWAITTPEDTTDVVSGSGTPLTGHISGYCPQGLAVGFQGRTGAVVDQLRLTCAQLNEDGSLGLSIPGVSLGNSAGGSPDVVTCPVVGEEPTVLVGVSGYTNGDLHQANGRCRLLSEILAGMANDTAGRRTGEFGGGPHVDSEAYDVACPPGMLIVGLRGRQHFTTHFPVEVAYLCRTLTYE